MLTATSPRASGSPPPAEIPDMNHNSSEVSEDETIPYEDDYFSDDSLDEEGPYVTRSGRMVKKKAPLDYEDLT